MAEYVGRESTAVDVGDPITFENKTDDSFSVNVGIVFRKSGLYRVSITGKHTSVEIVPSAQPIIRCKDCKFYIPMNRETKTGICRLLMHQNFGDDWYCAGAERRTYGVDS